MWTLLFFFWNKTGHSYRNKIEINGQGDNGGGGDENHQENTHQYTCLLIKSSHKDTQHSFTFMCTTECKLQKKGPSSAEWNEIEQDYLCISLSIDHLFQQHTQLGNTRSRFLHALITITFQPPSQSRNQGTKSVSTLGTILNTHFKAPSPPFLFNF